METQNTSAAMKAEEPTGDINAHERPDEESNEETSNNDITPGEVELLDNAGTRESADDDDVLLADSQLDDEDEDGDKLNEDSDLTGEDLDVPGSEFDDDDESIGEEDEENNSYSIRDQDDDL